MAANSTTEGTGARNPRAIAIGVILREHRHLVAAHAEVVCLDEGSVRDAGRADAQHAGGETPDHQPLPGVSGGAWVAGGAAGFSAGGAVVPGADGSAGAGGGAGAGPLDTMMRIVL